MKTYLLNLWDVLRSSYWFVPMTFAVGSVVISVIMPRVDIAIDESGMELPEWILTTTTTARSTLSAMAGAMVAVTGTVFSITIVTLSLTSQQLGPRLLRRFMYDFPTQVTLGMLISTGLYCLLLLRVVESPEDGLITLHLSVATAVLLAVLSMGILIAFIHHVAVHIQAPQVVAAVAADLDDSIIRLFPEKIGEPPSENDNQRSAGDQASQLGADFMIIRSAWEGYIQAIDGDGLFHLAETNDLVIRLQTRPGDFVALDYPIAHAWHVDRDARKCPTAEAMAGPLNETIIVGIRRTPRQDVECAVDELVEVAVRSLSPGINDPFTAINCIDRLGASLRRLAKRRMPSPYRCDEDGRLRVIARPIRFADVLDASLNQIRQYGRDSVAVTIRLLEILAPIAEEVRRDGDRQAVKRHAEMIARNAKSCTEKYDRDAVLERLEKVMQLLDQQAA